MRLIFDGGAEIKLSRRSPAKNSSGIQLSIQLELSPILSRHRHSRSQLRRQNKSTRAKAVTRIRGASSSISKSRFSAIAVMPTTAICLVVNFKKYYKNDSQRTIMIFQHSWSSVTTYIETIVTQHNVTIASNTTEVFFYKNSVNRFS